MELKTILKEIEKEINKSYQTEVKKERYNSLLQQIEYVVFCKALKKTNNDYTEASSIMERLENKLNIQFKFY